MSARGGIYEGPSGERLYGDGRQVETYDQDHRLMTKARALTLMRVFVKIEQQVEIAAREGREEDMMSLCQLFGRLSYECFGFGLTADLGDER